MNLAKSYPFSSLIDFVKGGIDEKITTSMLPTQRRDISKPPIYGIIQLMD